VIYRVDEKTSATLTLTDEGYAKAEELLNVQDLSILQIPGPHYITTLLKGPNPCSSRM